MWYKKWLMAGLSVGLILSGCGKSESVLPTELAGDFQVNVVNLSIENYFVKGDNIQSFDHIPARIVVTGETEIETVLDLGLEKYIVMAIASNYRSFHMKEANQLKLEKLPFKNRAYLNVEYVTALHPDILIAEQDRFVSNGLRDTDYWNSRGVRTMVPPNSNTPSKHIRLETLEQDMNFLHNLGEIFQVEERTAAIEQETAFTIADIHKKIQGEPKPKVMFVEFLSALISYDRTKLAGNLAEHIGAVVPETPPVITFDHLIQEDPDVLFVVCSHRDYGACITKITANPALRQLRCVKEHHVYSIPLRYTYCTLVRTPDSLRYMAQCMYPQCYVWQDIR